MNVYNYHVFCCVNERDKSSPRGCCKSKRSQEVRDYLKKRVKELKIPKIRINQSGCLDKCEFGPVIVIYPESIWYKCKNIEQAEEIIQSHLMDKKPLEKYRILHNKV